MSQAESIPRCRQKPRRNPSLGFSILRALPADHNRIGICSAVMSLCLVTVCFAGGSGPGIAFKVGAQTMDSPIDFEKTTRARFELELASPKFGNDYFDVALTLGGSSFGCFHEEYAGYDKGVLIEEFYTDRYSIFDVSLVGRLYPLGDYSRLQPYIGAGIGYFWFLDSWNYEYYETYEDPFIPGVFYTYIETDEGRETLARGFFPFVTAGLAVPVNSNFNLLFEAQYHYNKKDSGFDFGGPVYMFGCQLRF